MSRRIVDGWFIAGALVGQLLFWGGGVCLAVWLISFAASEFRDPCPRECCVEVSDD